MTLPRGPGSSRHGRGLVSGAGKVAKLWKYALTGTGHYSSGSSMRGGCATCGGRPKRRRAKKARIIRLGRFRGTGMSRTRSVTVTMPSGKSVTRSRGYSRALGPQQVI